MAAAKAWTMTICVCAVVCALIEMLAPKGHMRMVMRFVLGLFMLGAVCTPLGTCISKILPKLESNEPTTSPETNFAEKVTEQLKETSETRLKEAINAQLKTLGTTSIKVEIFMDTDADRCISINKVQVHLPRESVSLVPAAKDHLEKTLGVPVEVFS